MYSIKLFQELSKAISQAHLGPNVQRFLTQKGVDLKDVHAKGGPVQILLNMVPSPYSTISDLVQAIKSA